MKLDVNTDAAIQLTAKLEKLSKSAFPSAVRNTLNELAFEHKKLIPKTAKQKFEYSRNKTLFNSITKVEKAHGFNVNKMKSITGLNPNSFGGKAKKLVDNLEKQEIGGTIKGRKLLNHPNSRTGNSIGGKVRNSDTFSNSNLHDSTEAFKFQLKRSNKKSAYIAAVASSIKKGQNKFIIKAGRKGKLSGMAYSISGFKSNVKTGKTTLKTRKIFGYINNNTFNAKKRNFISDSTKIVVRKTELIYTEKAQYQFKKVLK